MAGVKKYPVQHKSHEPEKPCIHSSTQPDVVVELYEERVEVRQHPERDMIKLPKVFGGVTEQKILFPKNKCMAHGEEEKQPKRYKTYCIGNAIGSFLG